MFLYDTNSNAVPILFEGVISDEVKQAVCNDSPLIDWWKTINANKLSVSEILVQSIDIFGSGRIGFVKVRVSAREVSTGNPVPGILFLRGGSVVVLPILVMEDGELCTLICRQMSVAFGYPTLGCPSGMLDGDGNFAGKAAIEVQEETGVKLVGEDLIDLVDLFNADGDNDTELQSSPGGSDETFRLYASVVHDIKKDQLDHLLSSVHGTSEYEHITLLRVPLVLGQFGSTILQVTHDAKSYVAAELTDKAIAGGLISLDV